MNKYEVVTYSDHRTIEADEFLFGEFEELVFFRDEEPFAIFPKGHWYGVITIETENQEGEKS